VRPALARFFGFAVFQEEIPRAYALRSTAAE